VRLDGATVIRTPSLPAVAHLNTLVVHAGLDADAVEALASEQRRGLASRRVVVDDEGVGERLGFAPVTVQRIFSRTPA
jgi:hypothetical protein